MSFEEEFPSLKDELYIYKDGKLVDYNTYPEKDIVDALDSNMVVVDCDDIIRCCLDKQRVKEAIRYMEGLCIITTPESQNRHNEYNNAIRDCQKRLLKEFGL